MGVQKGGFGGGRVQRGRSGWEGSVAPPQSLDINNYVRRNLVSKIRT